MHIENYNKTVAVVGNSDDPEGRFVLAYVKIMDSTFTLGKDWDECVSLLIDKLYAPLFTKYPSKEFLKSYMSDLGLVNIW